MPRIKRWFPVSHDINADPEVWAMRHQVGEKSLSVWLEFLSIADRNEGELPGDLEELLRLVSGRCQAAQRTVRGVYEFALSRLWLTSRPPLKVVKWGKYHRTEERKPAPSEPSEPNPTEPNRKDKIKSIRAIAEFPPDWLWLKTFVESQNSGLPVDQFLDFAWWDAVSETCGGLSEVWLKEQFAGIKRWILDNPSRTPTPKGYRRFVGGWLQRSYERERRVPNGKTAQHR